MSLTSSSELDMIVGIGMLILIAAIVILCISRVYTEFIERSWMRHDKDFKAMKWNEKKYLKGQPGVVVPAKTRPLDEYSIKFERGKDGNWKTTAAEIPKKQNSDAEASEDLLRKMDV